MLSKVMEQKSLSVGRVLGFGSKVMIPCAHDLRCVFAV